MICSVPIKSSEGESSSSVGATTHLEDAALMHVIAYVHTSVADSTRGYHSSGRDFDKR